MKIVRVGAAGAERPGIVVGEDSYLDLSPVHHDIDGPFLAGLLGGDIATLAESRTLEVRPLAGCRLAAPIPRPGKIVCIGLNYADHAVEAGMAIPAEPIVFFKASNTLVGPNDDVRVPRGSLKTDWEVELGVLIGAECRYLESPDDAWSRIAGYVVSHDVSEREFQLERGGQWVKGKSCETFNPCGPWLVTPDEIGDVGALPMWLDVNGERRQTGSTATMVFDVPHLVWYLSQFMVLDAGDLINTGTPPGVGMGMKPPQFLRPGDIVEMGVQGLRIPATARRGGAVTTELAGRWVLVTGGMRGIGLAVGVALAEAGASVVVHDLEDQGRAGEVEAVLLAAGAPAVEFVFFDLRDASAVGLGLAQVAGRRLIDVVVNNAGMQATFPLGEMDRATWDGIIATNLSAAFETMRTFLPGMRVRGYGRVVNIASVHGLVASVDKAAYVAAKHGLVGLTKVAALEYADAGSAASGGVTVDAICPGWTETALIEPQIQRLAAAHGGDRAAGVVRPAVREAAVTAVHAGRGDRSDGSDTDLPDLPQRDRHGDPHRRRLDRAVTGRTVPVIRKGA